MNFCLKCVSEKPIGDECIVCAKTKRKRYVAANYAATRERASIANKRRYWANPKRDNQASAAWRACNRERHLANIRAWMTLHPNQNRKWRLANPNRWRELVARRSARAKGAIGSHTRAEWLAIIDKQKGRCADCGEKCPLTQDHIVPIDPNTGGGCDFAYNIQGLCKPCNSRKKNKILAGVTFSLFDRVPAKMTGT